LPLFFLGTQHGVQYPPFADPPLTLGTGVGSGFVAGRRLVTSGDEVPANGWVYCLPFEGGIVDEAFSTRWVCGRYRELTGQEISGAREAAERHAEDPAARRLFDEYGERLAAFAAPVAERFRADMLVLGGNISRAYPLFGPAMERRLEADGHRIRIGLPARPDHAALIGAASLFI
ncbi:MAG: ROK family protein, partial [Alistipes onderdonkii]|nr:ROK family protein [Alistipes onderdonkii]